MEEDKNEQTSESKGVFPNNQSGEISVINSPSTGNVNTKTYFKLENSDSEEKVIGVLEIDLISFREKGQESRYLSILAVGSDSEGNQVDTTLSIDNEADFNQFKQFISQLSWND